MARPRPHAAPPSVGWPLRVTTAVALLVAWHRLWSRWSHQSSALMMENLGEVRNLPSSDLRGASPSLPAPPPPPPPPFVTFIIPSKGRDSLNRTLASLAGQTNPHWAAVVVLDGPQEALVAANRERLSDPRIATHTMPKTGEQNFAATLRNYGMAKAAGATSVTAWFGFVDDDDVLAPDYVARLAEETQLDPSVETVIFRMIGKHYGNLYVFPPEPDTMVAENRVGISFAIRRDLFDAGFWFQPSSSEDFQLLKKIADAQRRMVMAPYVGYYVNDVRPANPDKEYPRRYIN